MKNKLHAVVLVVGLFITTINYAQPNWGTNTLDPTSSAFGDGNIVNGRNSTAVGTGNVMNLSSTDAGFMAGRNNNVDKDYSFAFGLSNIVSGTQSGAFGTNNNVSGLNAFSFGHSNKSTAPHSFTFGRNTQANGTFSFTFGQDIVNTKNYSFLIGFDANQPVFSATKDTTIGAKVGIGTDNPEARFDVRLGDKQEIRIQPEVPNTYGGISFKHSDGSENWRIRAFSNFHGGYGNILSIVSSNKDNLWISAGKTMIGDWFDFDPCEDCDDYELFVKKGIRTQKIKVDVAAGVWADYVFAKNYNLKPLEEVETFINENGHLPNIPSAEEVESEGLNLGEIDAKLLEKIEELTLYVIELKKEINELKKIK
ncbi:hypothetical protein [Kordia jejudonensis]|uniref:hypothetical protein n=1 Tax=Kordia jejudonensis TaxID=1348245 RepID=UPI0006294D18|nr:hypothetical protein [Kordia jejudonensis]